MKFRRLAVGTTSIAVCLFASVVGQDAVILPVGKSTAPSIPYKRCWAYSLPDSNGGTLVSSNGTVFFAEPGGRIRALSSKSAEVNWVTELGGNIVATLVIPKVGLAVVTKKQGADSTAPASLRLLNTETGLVAYSVPLSVSEDIYFLTDGENIIVGEKDGDVSAFDARTGAPKWTAQLSAKLTAPPAVSGEVFVAATLANKLDILSTKSGKSMGAIPVEKKITALTIRDNEMIVAGDERGGVTTYRNYQGEIWWRFKSGAKIGTVIGTSDGVVVGSFDNFVYLLSNYSGDVKWKRRLNGRIISEPLVVGNQVFVASSTDEYAVGIDLNNGRSTDQLQFGENRFLTTKPVFTNHDTIVFGLTGSLAGFSQNGCTPK